MFNSSVTAPPQIRRRCRHGRCAARLKTPATNPRDAFCCRACFENFYLSRCLVCERQFDRKTTRRQVCNRQKCRGEFRRHRERYFGTRYPESVLSQNASGSTHSTGLKTGTKSGRPFRIVAGPVPVPAGINLRIPLDPEFEVRLTRVHAPFVEARERAKRAAARKALIKRRTWPVEIIGRRQNPAGPVIDLSPIDPPCRWGVQSRWKPMGSGADMPGIPEFLVPNVPAAPQPAATEEADPVPGAGLHKVA